MGWKEFEIFCLGFAVIIAILGLLGGICLLSYCIVNYPQEVFMYLVYGIVTCTAILCIVVFSIVTMAIGTAVDKKLKNRR